MDWVELEIIGSTLRSEGGGDQSEGMAEYRSDMLPSVFASPRRNEATINNIPLSPFHTLHSPLYYYSRNGGNSTLSHPQAFFSLITQFYTHSSTSSCFVLLTYPSNIHRCSLFQSLVRCMETRMWLLRISARPLRSSWPRVPLSMPMLWTILCSSASLSTGALVSHLFVHPVLCSFSHWFFVVLVFPSKTKVAPFCLFTPSLPM